MSGEYRPRVVHRLFELFAAAGDSHGRGGDHRGRHLAGGRVELVPHSKGGWHNYGNGVHRLASERLDEGLFSEELETSVQPREVAISNHGRCHEPASFGFRCVAPRR